MPPQEERFLKISEAATYLGVSRRTIYNLIKGGDIERVDLNLTHSDQSYEWTGSRRPHPRIPLTSLQAYTDRHRDLNGIHDAWHGRTDK